MEIKIVFDGRIPSKKNGRMNLAHTSLPSAEYREWHSKWRSALIKQYGGRAYLLQGCTLFYYYTFGSMRDKDISNAKESINDLLQDCGILNQDSWIDLKGGGDFSAYRKNIWECKVWIIDKDSSINHPLVTVHNELGEFLLQSF